MLSVSITELPVRFLCTAPLSPEAVFAASSPLLKVLTLSGSELPLLEAMLNQVIDWVTSGKEGRLCITSGTSQRGSLATS